MFWIDWQMTLVALIAIPIILPPMQGIAKKLRRNARAMQEETGSMASHVAESLGAARIAKTYRLEDYLAARAQKSFETMRQLKMKGADQRARLDPLLESAGGLAVAAVLFFISWRIISGQATVGDFTGFITALLLAAQSLRAIGNLNSILQEAAAALHRFFGTLDIKPQIVDAPDAVTLEKVKGRITFRDVSFSYDGHEPALHDIGVTIEPGQRVALVGPSGSGKSTLISLVPRLFDVTGGAIEIDGHDIKTITLASLRDAMAAVSQDPLLFDETVRVNIALGRPGATDAEIEDAATAAAAHEFIMQLPEGYETRVGERGSRLSGGQRQRIAIARAILRDAPILILDEATSALDSESERAVQDALDRLAKGRTSLVIAHRLSTIRDADLILVMDNSRIVERGTHDALIERDGLYRRLHRLQTA
jgi:subfamily B ATP-binding cassette protein MsbA